MSEIEKEIPLPLDEQVSMELVKHNYTEAKLQEFEEYLKLDIVDDDKEAYLLIKDKRKEVKSYRVAVEKFCKFKREDAVKIQKAWVSKENELVEKISRVEGYLEGKEKAYEKKIAEEREARKRKQEEQLILRQQKLTAMGALYSDGNFILGEVSFEFSAIKESEDDIWNETIYPAFESEYKKIQAEEIEKARLQQEREAELKRQQEELDAERKRLKEESDRLQAEKERQELEAANKRSQHFEFRSQQLKSIGFEVHGVDWYAFREFKIAMADVWDWNDNEWTFQIVSAKQYIEQVLAEEAEEKRKEQERKDLQHKRYAELLPFDKFGDPVKMDSLWDLSEDQYMGVYEGKKAAFQEAEDARIAELKAAAAKKERERIEEEQRKAEVKRKEDLRKSRMSMLVEHDLKYHGDFEVLGEISEEAWMNDFNELKANRDEIIRKQEEERKAEELAKAGDKDKWNEIMERIEAIEVYAMRSSQYRKKAAILREKLEEIKSL